MPELSEHVTGSSANRNNGDLPFWMEIKSRHVFTLAVLIILGYVLYLARETLGPYILAVVLSYMILPLVRRVESWLPSTGRFGGLHRPIATLGTMVVVLGMIFGLIYLLAEPVVDELASLADTFPEYWEDATDSGSIGEWYAESVPEDVQVWLDENVSNLGQKIIGGITDVLSYLFSVTGSLVSAIFSFVVVPLFAVYFLIDRPGTEARIRKLLPERWVDDTIEVFGFTDSIMASYTRGVIVTSIIVGAITGLGYWVIGVDIWISLGIIAFVGEIVPILGPWIAFFISFPIILVTQPDKALLAAVVFGVVQALEGWFISPKIQGDSIELPASLVLIGLAIGGAVGGAIGIVIALPAIAIARALVVYIMNRLDGFPPSAAAASLFYEPSEMADERTTADVLT